MLSSLPPSPEDKKVYCEIGFLPQAKNVYFDRSGAQGHSSLRKAKLLPLSKQQKERLELFRSDFAKSEFVRVKWDSIDIKDSTRTGSIALFDHEFIFVPLQLESDTAFDLCPFDDNQSIISFVHNSFPDHTIVFKVHPQDENRNYTIDPPNILLPHTNKDSRELIRQCKAVVASNSTVILEALALQKKCATFGIGLTTNHGVSLECHDNLAMLPELFSWEPGWDKVDSFLYALYSTGVAITVDSQDRSGLRGDCFFNTVRVKVAVLGVDVDKNRFDTVPQ